MWKANRASHIRTASTATTAKSNAGSATQPTTFQSLIESAKNTGHYLDTTSFGCSPRQQHNGLAKADRIEAIEV